MQTQSIEEIKRVCQHWLTYVAPKEFEGYVDDKHNGDLLRTYIKYSCEGYFTPENLYAAASHHKNNLHGVGVACTPEQKAAKEKAAADKAGADVI